MYNTFLILHLIFFVFFFFAGRGRVALVKQILTTSLITRAVEPSDTFPLPPSPVTPSPCSAEMRLVDIHTETTTQMMNVLLLRSCSVSSFDVAHSTIYIDALYIDIYYTICINYSVAALNVSVHQFCAPKLFSNNCSAYAGQSPLAVYIYTHTNYAYYIRITILVDILIYIIIS